MAKTPVELSEKGFEEYVVDANIKLIHFWGKR